MKTVTLTKIISVQKITKEFDSFGNSFNLPTIA